MHDSMRVAGRTVRGVVAAVAMLVCSLAALIMLTWSCCSTPSLASKLADPLVWCVGAAAAVALAVFPPVTRRLRQHRVRWLLLPFVLADLALCCWLGREIVQALSGGDAYTGGAIQVFLPLLVPNVICALYAAWRLVLRPPGHGGAA